MMSRQSKRGFTIAEILVASAVMAVMVSVIVSVTSSILTTYNRATGQLGRAQQARAILDYVQNDLEAAIFRNNGEAWMYAKNQGARDNRQTERLVMVTSPQDNDPEKEPGVVSLVTYLLDDRDALGEELPQGVNSIYRLKLSPEETFNDYLGQITTSGGKIKKSKVEGINPNSAKLRRDSYLSSQISQFEVRFYAIDNTKSDPVEDEISDGQSSVQFPYEDAVDFEYLAPTHADIILNVIDSKGMEQLDAISQGFIEADAAEVIEEHSELFTRRIYFMTKPL